MLESFYPTNYHREIALGFLSCCFATPLFRVPSPGSENRQAWGLLGSGTHCLLCTAAHGPRNENLLKPVTRIPNRRPAFFIIKYWPRAPGTVVMVKARKTRPLSGGPGYRRLSALSTASTRLFAKSDGTDGAKKQSRNSLKQHGRWRAGPGRTRVEEQCPCA